MYERIQHFLRSVLGRRVSPAPPPRPAFESTREALLARLQGLLGLPAEWPEIEHAREQVRPDLLEIGARDPRAVRGAGLPGALRTIQDACAASSDPHLRRSLLRERALLGDATAFHDVLALTDWRSSRGMDTYFDLLHAVGGEETLLRAVYGPALPEGSLQERLAWVFRNETSGPARAWALVLLSRDAGDLGPLEPLALEALGVGGWVLSYEAVSILRRLPTTERAAAELYRIAGDEATPRERRLWAVFALQEMGEDTTAARARIEELRVPLATPVPALVREAILHDVTVHEVEMGTDVRWMIEGSELGAFDGADGPAGAQERSPALRAALAEEGIAHSVAVSYSDWIENRYVYGTFRVLPLEGAHLRLSELGPFVSAEGTLEAEREARLRRAVERAGLLWLEPETLDTIVTGLIVERTYLWDDFGERTVREFLFRIADTTG